MTDSVSPRTGYPVEPSRWQRIKKRAWNWLFNFLCQYAFFIAILGVVIMMFTEYIGIATHMIEELADGFWIGAAIAFFGVLWVFIRLVRK